MSNPGRVASGTPVGRLLKASRVNYVLEGAELAHRLATGPSPGSRPGGRIPLVRNTLGSDLTRFAVLGIGGPVFDPAASAEAERAFQNHFPLLGSTPNAEQHTAGRFAVLQAPTRGGDWSPAVLNGLTVCRLFLPDELDYTECGVLTGETDYLTVEESGTVVVWHETGPGVKWAVVNLGSGGGGECPNVHQFYIEGNPTSGTVEWRYQINSVTGDIGLTFGMTSAEAETEFETHSQVADGQVSVSGGPFPHVSLEAQFAGELTVVWPPVQQSNSLAAEVNDPLEPRMKVRRYSS